MHYKVTLNEHLVHELEVFAGDEEEAIESAKELRSDGTVICCLACDAIAEEVTFRADKVALSTNEALRAIRARIRGEFDNPCLMEYGPLHEDSDVDVLELVRMALSGECRLS
jgi:hypothetical protein